MTSKPKSRKLAATPDTHGDQPATTPAPTPTPTPTPVELPSSAEANGDRSGAAPAAALSKSARKKRAPPPARPSEAALLTVDARLKKLAKLPSLETPLSSEQDKIILIDSVARPPAPPPPPEEPAPSQLVDRGSTIPENYGLDRLVSLPRDAHWVYVYWELQGGALDRLRFHQSAEFIDNARWVLRVRPVNVASSAYVDVDMRIGQWYLHVAPGTRFAIDMGLFDQQGQFVEVLRGNEVATPGAGISAVCDERWIVLRDDLEKLLKASSAPADERSLHGSGSEHIALPRSEQPRAIGIFSSYLLHKESRQKADG